MAETEDKGLHPESEAMFESDMAVYLNAIRRRNKDPEHLKQIEENIELMKKWRADGK